MTRCKLCNIDSTDDPYAVCGVCRDKARRGWKYYPEHVKRVEDAQRAQPCQQHGEPDDAEFLEAMGWA